MSAVEDSYLNIMMCCASCGIAGVDNDVKLKNCTACYLVRYCSVKCQRDHRPQHKKECKKKAAELRDEILFKQPESSHLGDCPICCLPLSINNNKSTLMECCSKLVCNGCDYANMVREWNEKLEPRCPFCRHPAPTTEEEIDRNRMKRVKANDPASLSRIGYKRYEVEDYKGAIQYYAKAAQLGDIVAHFNLAVMYGMGQGVEKDEKKRLHHLEEAAIGGHPIARDTLARVEWGNGMYERAVKHFIIAANLGLEQSMEDLPVSYSIGNESKELVSQEDIVGVQRAYQAAIAATKSPQREAAEMWRKGLQLREHANM